MEYLLMIVVASITIRLTYHRLKPKEHETISTKTTDKFLNDEWELWVSEASGSTPEKSFSIELLNHKNYPVTKGVEAFSIN